MIEDQEVWRIESEIPKWSRYKEGNLHDGTIYLESDTNNRADYKNMVLNKWDEAEEEKIKMEELQRKDKAGRTAVEK